jgi:hypothetical protein
MPAQPLLTGPTHGASIRPRSFTALALRLAVNVVLPLFDDRQIGLICLGIYGAGVRT